MSVFFLWVKVKGSYSVGINNRECFKTADRTSSRTERTWSCSLKKGQRLEVNTKQLLLLLSRCAAKKLIRDGDT